MSTAPRYVPHYTIADHAQWEGDWELIDGVAIAMTPSPFGPHERVVSRLSRMIGNQIEKSGCSCEVYTNLDWIVRHDTVIRPDLMVVCGEQPQRHLERPPDLVVEVLSDSTRGHDLTAKLTLCRDNKVPHYLVIDPDQRTCVHFTEGSESCAGIDQNIELLLGIDCEIQIAVAPLFDR